MKIIFIADKYDYGDSKRGFSKVYYDFYETLVKMNNGENEVIFFATDEKTKEKGLDGMNKELLELALKTNANLIFFYTGSVKKEVVKEITQKSGATTLSWFLDDHWAFYNASRHWAPLYHWICTTDPLAVERYHKIGYQNAIFTPLAYNHFRYKLQNLPKIYDVSFIGRPHGVRKKIIKKLKKAGINVACFSEGWPKGWISHEEMLKVFSQSKINLNLVESSGVLWKQLGLIFLNRKFDRSIGINSPLKWYENFQTLLAQKRKQIKGRMFRIPGCGGFLLTGYTEKLEDLYIQGKEMDCFFNINELIEKIKYYLSHDEERERIAKAGYERTLRDHTYEKRFNEIFKAIGLKK